MRALLACAAFTLLVGACSTEADMEAPQAQSPPDRKPDVEGFVADVTRYVARTEGCTTVAEDDPNQPVSSDDPPSCSETASDTQGGVLVEGAGCGISFAVVVETRILRRTGSGFEEATLEDLGAGRHVRAWASGPIAESCPMQAEAETILLHE